MGIARFFAVSILTIISAVNANADELNPAFLGIDETSEFTYDIVWKNPITKGRPLKLEPQFPEDCKSTNSRVVVGPDNAIIATAILKCTAKLQGREIGLAGLNSLRTDVLVRFRSADGSLQALHATPDSPTVSVAAAATRKTVAAVYVRLGVEHILAGTDHLLFVLALVLLTPGFRRLVETITAFTVAHSVTLVCAALGWVSAPPAAIEALIALSILYLAVQLANGTGGEDTTNGRRNWTFAFGFGLLHGFGFAGALMELGLPSGEVPLALFAFNLGIEAGQLLFVIAIVIALMAIRRFAAPIPVRAIVANTIGAISAFWVIQRATQIVEGVFA